MKPVNSRQRQTLVPIAVVLAAASTILAAASYSASAQPGQEITPEQALRRLQAGNQRFSDDKSEKPELGAARRQELARGQKPFAIVLTCADSRLTPEFIFNQGLGDLFVLRVAGNVAGPFIVGSIEYAVEHLHVPLIVLLGHEKCGAVEAALGEDKPKGNLGKLIADIDIGRDLPADKTSALATAVRNNALHQAQLLQDRSPIIKEHVAANKLRILSGVYHLSTGKVEWLPGTGAADK